jgi:hypothetical protein
MPIRTLSTELVPLVHHIELAKAGWPARLAEQLVAAVAYGTAQSLSQDEFRQAIERQYGVRMADGEISRALGYWRSNKAVLEIEPGRFRLSEAQRGAIQKQISETANLETDAHRAFDEILTKHGLVIDGAWVSFQTKCLRPLISDVGARIYHVLSGEPPTADHDRHIESYTSLYDPAQRSALASAVDEFIRSSPPPARRYILQHLHAHLLMSAASLPAPTLDRLQTRLKSTTQLTLIVDTNVLFSILDLHENPGNDPSRDLLELASKLKGKLNIKVAVLPLTLDEAKRTLLHYKQRLSRLDVTAALGRTALRSDGALSGITQRYLQAAAQGKARVSAEAYFEPYLDDLVTIARSKGIELYNENTDKLGTRQDVVDDILDQQKREERKGDAAKPYESIHHDVVAWHCVNDRRSAASKGPLDAASWLVTLDFQLLGFDSFKHRSQASYIPVCVHPTVLVQLLQLWLPREEAVDDAMLQSLRPMLPHEFDPDVEEVTLKILASLSRYENVDDLGEDTISEILMNQALRQRMRAEKDIERQTKLVRDAIIEQVEQAKEALKRAQDEQKALSATLLEGQSERDRLAKDLEEQRALAESQKQLAGNATTEAQTLTGKVSDLEEELRRSREAAVAAERALERGRFLWKTIGALVAGLALTGIVVYSVGSLRGVRGVLGGAATWLAAWIQVAHWLGQKSESVREWPPFVTFCRWRGALWTGAGAILLGVVSNRIYDALKAWGW